MTAPHQRGPRLLILGSCVSRDILNFGGSASISLADYYARSSIASLATVPFQMDEASLDRITSEFQRRMVQRDLDKSLLQNLAAHRDVDFIVIDLIDERFDLYEIADESVATLSSEFLLTRVVTARDRSSSRWIPSGSASHRQLWKAGLEKLFAALEQHGIADRVLVNKVFWADQMEDGSALPAHEADAHLSANALLAWMYQELEHYVPTQRWLSFSYDLLKANPRHRWGPAPFHYTDAYYTSAVAQLNKHYAEQTKHDSISFTDGILVVRSAIASHRTSFMVFRDKALLKTEPYATWTEMQFDTGNIAGDYEVIVLTLTSDSKQPTLPARRNESVHRFRLGESKSA